MAFVQTDYQFLMQNLVQDTEVKQEALLKENLKLLTQKKGALEFTNQAWQKKKKKILHWHKGYKKPTPQLRFIWNVL